MPKLRPLDPTHPDLIRLLAAENLPTQDLLSGKSAYFGWFSEQGDLLACGGIEDCGAHALIRSCVVAPDRKGKGQGRALVEALMGEARARGYSGLYLLTETASDFFAKFGFTRIKRDSVPKKVALSSQFAEICPQSAITMTKRLDASS